MNETLQVIVEILIQLSTTIPLIIALVKFIIKAVKEKNWKQLVAAAFEVMADAEEKFKTGAEREEYAIGIIREIAEQINYPISEDEIRKLITDTIALTKKINVTK